MNVWIEVRSGKHRHEALGWELGRFIWSPSTDRRGVVGKYKVMMSVKEGDFVINCSGGIVRGTSFVAGECVSTREKPSNAGPWSYAQAFFKIPLRDFESIIDGPSITQIARDNKDLIRSDIEALRPKYYLFSLYPNSEFNPSGKIVLSQGRFLAKATPELTSIFVSYLRADPRI